MDSNAYIVGKKWFDETHNLLDGDTALKDETWLDEVSGFFDDTHER